MKNVPSMAFSLKVVNAFSVVASKFDRVAMWGFRLKDCVRFSLEESKFFSVGSRAFHVKTDEFVVEETNFVNLQEGSFAVTFASAFVVNNVFDNINQKPFVQLKPVASQTVIQVSFSFHCG